MLRTQGRSTRFALAACLFLAVGASARSAAGEEPTVLRFAFPAPATSVVNTGGVTPWIREVEESSKGTLQIKLFPGPAVSTFTNVYDRVVNGVVAFGFGTIGAGSPFKKTEVSQIPFETSDTYEAGLALWRLYESGVTASDFKTVKLLALFTFASSGELHSVKPIRTIDDLRGMKVAAYGRLNGQTLEAAGAVPVTMTPADSYETLSRGVISAATMSWPGVMAFKLQEVAKYHLDVALGAAGGFIIMNKSAYARLPAAARAAIDAHSGEVFTRRLGQTQIEEDARLRKVINAMPGQQTTALSPEEEARWKKAIEPVVEEWVKETPDGAHVLAAYREQLARAHSERNAPRSSQ
jgi:TRAP-type C4-dicarboxylate transport system substrate-binding protein